MSGAVSVSPGPTAPPLPTSMGAQYYYPYTPPPRRNNLALIIVLVVVILVVLPAVAAAVLYVMVSGLILPPAWQPTVSFGAVTLQAGNATVPVASVSGNIDPGSLLILLQANYSASSAVGMPPPGGGYTSVATGGHVFRVYWMDADQNRLLSSGDGLRVTGDNMRLPASTTFTIYLRAPDGANLAGTGWNTP